MDIQSIIRRKRAKQELTEEEIKYFVGKFNRDEITEGQAAALMSYIYINGLTQDEILTFSKSIAESGDVIDLTDISENVVDKYSTGGVGDKVSLLLMPILAALDVPIANVSSRGYGITSGTIDKLDSIPGFRTDITIEEFKKNLKKTGIAVMNQGLNFAPVERKLYRLRNQIACENSLPIIASSLMGLKLATGGNRIVFDITCGRGTYIATKEDAKRLAKLLIKLGKSLNKEVACIITDMHQPLGYSVGHNLEIKEVVMVLRGIISEDLGNVIEAIGSTMISLGTGNKDLEENSKMIKEVIKTGKAFEKFKEMVEEQGGDTSYIDDPEKLERSKYIMPVLATESGTVASIDADMVGSLATYLGAGRMREEDKIIRNAGITLNKKIGDTVMVGETLAYIHTDDEKKINSTTQNLKDAFNITTKKISPNNKAIEIIM